MAKYLRLQLDRGKGVVSEKNLDRTQTPQVAVGDKVGYGMGWLVGKYRGLVAVEHSGGTLGFSSNAERIDGGFRLGYREIQPGSVLRNYNFSLWSFHSQIK